MRNVTSQRARKGEGEKQPLGRPPSRTWRNQLISLRVYRLATTNEQPYGRPHCDINIPGGKGCGARKRGRKRERGRTRHRETSRRKNDIISLTFSRILPRFLASFRSMSEPADSCANGGCSAFLKPKANTRMARTSTTPTGTAYTYCECCNSRPTWSMVVAEVRANCNGRILVCPKNRGRYRGVDGDSNDDGKYVCTWMNQTRRADGSASDAASALSDARRTDI